MQAYKFGSGGSGSLYQGEKRSKYHLHGRSWNLNFRRCSRFSISWHWTLQQFGEVQATRSAKHIRVEFLPAKSRAVLYSMPRAVSGNSQADCSSLFDAFDGWEGISSTCVYSGSLILFILQTFISEHRLIGIHKRDISRTNSYSSRVSSNQFLSEVQKEIWSGMAH